MLVRLVLAIGFLVAAHAGNATAPALKQCRVGCTQAKRTCVGQAKSHQQVLRGDCVGTGAELRQCRRQAKQSGRAERSACGGTLHECRTCCTTGGTDCAVPPTTTLITSTTSPAVTSTMQLTTSTVIIGPTTTTLPPGCHFPATGQATCWDGAGTAVDCAGTGHDGEIRAGAPLSYTDNGDGTIRDNNTGLVWEKLSYDSSVHDVHNQYTWAQAFTTHVATLNDTAFAGHSDWRVPNVKELLSLVDYGRSLPAIAPIFDDNCQLGCTVLTCSCPSQFNTWTSTTNVNLPTTAWLVFFNKGSVGVTSKQATTLVRAVRGDTACLPATGQTGCWDATGAAIACAGTGQDGDLRAGKPLGFADNGDGTITDQTTQLTWEKQSRDRGIHETGNGYTWDQAFSDHVATLNGDAFAGHSDWRVPNLREFQNIVNYDYFEPASPPEFNHDCAGGCTVLTCSCAVPFTYWTSTTDAGSTSTAWYELFRRGDSTALSKSGRNAVRAVRGGS